MNKTAAVLGIIAGLLGIIAALFTAFFGGVASAMGAHNANTLINLGWGGVFFSGLTIVFGALAFSKPRFGGWGLVVASLLGAVLGGTFVAACLTLALLGGILAIASAPSMLRATPHTSHDLVHQTGMPQPQKNKSSAWWVSGTAAVIVVLFVLIGVSSKNDNSTSADKAKRQSDTSPLALLEAEPISDLKAGKLAEIFQLGGNATDVQRENVEAAIKGKVVDWQLRVFEVKRKGENYHIITESTIADLLTGPATASTRITLTPRNLEERTTIEALKTGDSLRIKGRIKGVTLRSLNIEPAVLWTATSTADNATPVSPEAPVAKTDNELLLETLKERYLTQCVRTTMQNAIKLGGMEKSEAAVFATESCKKSSQAFVECASALGSNYDSCYQISNPTEE
jgi:hypothetical protein